MCWIQHQKLRMMEPRFKLGFAVKTEPTKHATIFLGTNSSPTRPPSYTRHWKSPCVYVCVCEDLKNLFWDSQLRRNVLFGFGFSSRLRHNERRLARAQRRPSTRNFACHCIAIDPRQNKKAFLCEWPSGTVSWLHFWREQCKIYRTDKRFVNSRHISGSSRL